jgi:hypothetical protein
MATKLTLRVHKVKCVDETGGWLAEKAGNDEIYLGGFAVTHQNGETVKINPISIYPHFDDGDVKVFNPPLQFHTINLANAEAWPRTYAVGLVLVERDRGGMVEAVTKIADFFEVKLKERLAAPQPAAAALIPAALLKQAIVFVAPILFTHVKNVIIRAFEDEIFTPQIATLDLPDKDFTWSGRPDSAEKTVRFSGHDGTYDLTYDWLLS